MSSKEKTKVECETVKGVEGSGRDLIQVHSHYFLWRNLKETHDKIESQQ
jgi:hypothetical protein